ncbi:MAG: hypothetical protein JO166_19430 [Deltaproteobacteria bacterium]|nr:hypothetical protein [Deltaproteobacteria bacterium]
MRLPKFAMLRTIRRAATRLAQGSEHWNAYTDVVFGPVRVIDYRFNPQIADIGSARYYRALHIIVTRDSNSTPRRRPACSSPALLRERRGEGDRGGEG